MKKSKARTLRYASRSLIEKSLSMSVTGLGYLPRVGLFPGGSGLLARMASAGSTEFRSHAETLMTGKRREPTSPLGHLVMSRAPQGDVELAQIAIERGFASPSFLERVAARAERRGEADSALALRRRAVAMEPMSAHRHLALAKTLEKIPMEGVVHDWILGLSRGPKVDVGAESLEALGRAHELAPGNPYILYEYGVALVRAGDVEGGLPLLETAALKSPNRARFMDLAETYRRPDVARFEKALYYYERAVEDDPHNTKALAGIINAGARGPMDWPRMWRSVSKLETRKNKSVGLHNEHGLREKINRLFMEESERTAEDVSAAVQGIQAFVRQGHRMHPTVLGLIIIRLQFLRYFEVGFDLRKTIAESRLEKLQKAPVTTAEQLRNILRALVYLGDAETAASLTEPRFWADEDQLTYARVEKMNADAQLMNGNIVPYLQYSRAARERMPLPAEDRMAQLVTGKRVALVGPADTGDLLGKVIDDYDVIVRPRYQPQFLAAHRDSQGTRTDITYYSGQDLTSLFENIETAAEAGDVQVVNARPFSYSAHSYKNLSWLRFYRQDFSLCFHGASLGLQRIAYDLLQFEPTEISVFNADFYTGSSMFSPGWRERDTFGPNSLNNDIVVSHDVKFEFMFMKALMSTGILTAQGRPAEVLSQTTGEYVRSVEEAGVLR